jgi:hypothetical protein
MVKGCKMDDEKQAPGVFENLLFPKIFRTFRIAIQPTKLAIALGGIAVISLAGWLMDLNKTVVVTHNAEGMVTRSELDVYVDSPDMFQSYVETHEDARQAGVFSTLWHFDRQRFHDALYSLFSFKLPDVAGNIGECFKAMGWAFRHHLGYCIILVVIKLAVISIAGGAICRIAALQFAQGEKPGPTEALRFSTSKFLSFFTAPLLPVAFIAVAGLCVLLLAVIGNIPFFGDVVMALFMFLALFAGVAIAALVIGAVGGFNLMFPAVAYDGSDCFDAMSRSFNYVYSRPWRMLFYSTVATVYGAICYVFVRFFAFLLMLATYVFLDIGIAGQADASSKLSRIWSPPTYLELLGTNTQATANWAEWFSAHVVYLLLLVVIGLVVAFIFSFYFSANTIIYALIRNRADKTALDDVYTQPEGEPVAAEPDSQPESEPQESPTPPQTQDE